MAQINKYFEFAKQRIKFESFCFYGEKFPKCDFEKPALVKELIGPYTIAVTYYDAAGKKAATAEKPGRYAAVVEIKRADGRTSRRFVTLCRLAGAGRPETRGDFADPVVLEAGGVDKQVYADYIGDPYLANRMYGLTSQPAARTQVDWYEAIAAASLMDLTALKAAGKPLPKDTLTRIDRQWWVTFKRSFYGYDKLYPNAFVCPKPLEGKPATVVHEGTLAEAGMKPGAAEAIDAACQAWLKENDEGFNFVVLRHGVVVFNKAYGKQVSGPDKNAPFTTTTPAQSASQTKFLGGILLGEFADQGLIDFDAPVEKYVPPMQGIQVKRPVTVRDMYLHIHGLAHTAGADMDPDHEEIVADMYPGAEVGAVHAYGGTGLALGGKIMENMSGEAMPHIFMKHLIEPLGLKITNTDGTSGQAVGTAMDFAIIGQMMLNGGSYGDKKFLSPATIKKMQPIPGQDRWKQPGMDIRWGIGIKQMDIDGLSDQAYGHPGATGMSLVVDPKYDVVFSLARWEEGHVSFKQFLQQKAKVYKAVLDNIEEGK